jgi:anhydro-N-acetylmuramic acid kinase
MDAFDIVEAQFSWNGGRWTGSIEALHEVPLGERWPRRFKALETAGAVDWFECERDWSRWCAEQIIRCTNPRNFDVVAFSGQTIFHQPQQGYTVQLGSGSELHAAFKAAIPVVGDFRSLDVALGGQGAPLVPVADALLFGEFDACLNLGGFSNISMDQAGHRMAWDVSPCNLVLNALANRNGLPFDASGRLAAAGRVIPELLSDWAELPYHEQQGHKSLGVEWMRDVFWPVLELHEQRGTLATEDLLATAVAYIALEVRMAANGAKTLVTGGGALNAELVRRLGEAAPVARVDLPLEAVIPDATLLKGKEAYAFGFLGLLRWLELTNVWSTVTGCSQAHMGGALWGKNGLSSRSPNAMQ